MGTKLKKFSRNIFTKLAACLAILLCAALCVSFICSALKNNVNFDSLLTDDILRVGAMGLSEEADEIYNQLMNRDKTYRESVAEGYTPKFFLPDMLNDSKYEYYIEFQDGTVFKSDSVDASDKAGLFEKRHNLVIILGKNFDPDYGYGYTFNRYNNDYYDSYSTSYDSDQTTLRKYGAAVNSTSYSSAYKAVVIRLTEEAYAEYQQRWNDIRLTALVYLKKILVCFGIALVLFIYLCFVAGRKPNDNEVHLHKFDRIYSDIMIAVVVILFVSIIGIFIYEFNSNYAYYYYINTLVVVGRVFTATAITVAVILTAISLIVLLSLVRKVKAKQLIKNSLIFVILSFIFRILKKCVDVIKKLFDGRAYEKFPLTKRLFYSQLAFIIASFILVFFTFIGLFMPPMFILPIILEGILIGWYVVGNNKTFIEINKGFNDSIEEQMRAERMKINLVTNVSHDLKTPLTSIIGYIDLLSKEEGMSETAKDYISIIAEKSDRLKHIVADLFDIAKATSGDMSVDVEEIDIKKLVEQTVADMQDKIDSSELTIKTTLTDESALVMTDGKKMYRVLQNLIDNALKYSLKGTRVFIDVMTKVDDIVITVKNTSSYEMDFSSYEILQRFSRGDKARTTDGNGLGLSIAQSFTDSCGGVFDVVIDGDQFKVTIRLKRKQQNS